jgi:hypothetical protein
MDHGKGAGTTEPAPVGPAGDAGLIEHQVDRLTVVFVSIVIQPHWPAPLCRT